MTPNVSKTRIQLTTKITTQELCVNPLEHGSAYSSCKEYMQEYMLIPKYHFQ